jgi:hypothetical protein
MNYLLAYILFLPFSCIIVYLVLASFGDSTPVVKKPRKKRTKGTINTKELNKLANEKKTRLDNQAKKERLEEQRLEDKYYKDLVKYMNDKGIWDIPGVPGKYLKSPRVDGVLPLSYGTYDPRKKYRMVKRREPKSPK